MFILLYAAIFISLGYAINRFVESKAVVIILFSGITFFWAFAMGPWAIATLMELIFGYLLVDKPQKTNIPPEDFRLGDIKNGIKTSVATHLKETVEEKKRDRKSDAGINMFLSAMGFFTLLFLANNIGDEQSSGVFIGLALLCAIVFIVFSLVSSGKENYFTKSFFFIWDTVRYLACIGIVGSIIYMVAAK